MIILVSMSVAEKDVQSSSAVSIWECLAEAWVDRGLL